ncbi:MAG: hypothetical protein ACSLFR_00160 [Solirubrobacteraceae bacterium]
MGRAVVLAIAVLLLVPAFAGAQAVTRGSPLTATPNVPFGCEASVEQNFVTGLFELTPMGRPSCTWWSSGLAANPADPNTGYVPTTGTVTNVRVRSGPNPAALRLVQLRSTAGCCTVVRHTEPFQPAPNSVTQVTVNWLVEAVRDSVVGVSTVDVIGFSAIGNTGTLPLNDQGPATHTPQAAFQPGVHAGRMTAPMGQPGALLGENSRGAIGYEPLVQYDFVPCPALNNVPIAPGTVTCPGQNTVTPPVANAAPTAPPSTGVPGVNPISFPRGFNARLQGINVPLSLICSLDIGCSGTVRLALALGAGTARAAKTVTLGTKKFKIKKGRHQVKVKLGKKSRARLRKKKSTRVSAVVTIPGMPTLRTTLKVRR